MDRTPWVAVGFFLGGMLAVGKPAEAQQGTPSAEAIIEQSGAYARALKTVYGDVLSTFTTRRGPMVTRTQIWGDLPDKAAMHTASSHGITITYQLGTQQTIYFPKKNQYISSQVADTASVSSVQEFLLVGLGKNGPLSGDAGGRQLSLVGKQTVAGIPTNHVRVVLPNGNSADLYIADGAQPLPVYVRMTETQPASQSETFFRWIVDKPVPPAVFQFTPPPGATQINPTLPAVRK